MNNIELIISKIIKWSNTRSDVKCVINFGSLSTNKKDKFSDIDIMIFCSNPNFFLENFSWVNEIFPYQIAYTKKSMIESMPTVKVVFSNFVELDLVPLNYKEISKAFFFAKFSKTVFSKLMAKNTVIQIEENIKAFNNYTCKGLTYYIDKNNYKNKIEFISKTFPIVHEQLSMTMFRDNVNCFFHQLIQEGIKIERRELYASKECAEYFSKVNLREMIEWYMKMKNGNDYNTFCNGKKLEYWCDADIVLKMETIYSKLTYEGCKNSLFSTLYLYDEIALKVLSTIDYNVDDYRKTKNFTLEHLKKIFNEI